MRILMTALALVAAALFAAGCRIGPSEEEISGQSIMRPQRGRLPTEPYSPVDQPGQLNYDDASAPRELMDPKTRRQTPAGVAQAIDSAVRPLAEPIDPSTSPSESARRSTTSPGVFQTIGGVVAEVNDKPIYADKVVSDLELVFAARAKELSAQQFKAFAEGELKKQVTDHVNRELLHAAAERTLDQRDKDRAKRTAELWRQQQITLAGGSIETTRRRYAEHNRNFEEAVEEEHRRLMVALMLQTEIYPRIQVNAADMRRYYDRNREKEFTLRDAARFEMIQVDPAKVGGVEKAKARIEQLRGRAVEGENFAELAKYSNRPRLRTQDNELPWFDKGAFAIAPVEEAVWKLQPGETSEIIEDGGKLYIAQLEQKRAGRVIPFEDEETQAKIRETLTREQFRPMYEDMLNRLRRESIVRTDPQMMKSALEIAMQRYPQWAAK